MLVHTYSEHGNHCHSAVPFSDVTQRLHRLATLLVSEVLVHDILALSDRCVRGSSSFPIRREWLVDVSSVRVLRPVRTHAALWGSPFALARSNPRETSNGLASVEAVLRSFLRRMWADHVRA